MPRLKRWTSQNPLMRNVISRAMCEGMEVEDVAKAIKLPRGTLYNHLKFPNQMRLGTLKKLCSLFDCKIEDLIYPAIHRKETEKL